MPLTQVVLRVDEFDASGCCIIRCPICADRIAQPACDAMMTALVAVGVEISIAIPDIERTPPAGLITALELQRFVDRLTHESDLLRWIHSDEPPARSM